MRPKYILLLFLAMYAAYLWFVQAVLSSSLSALGPFARPFRGGLALLPMLIALAVLLRHGAACLLSRLRDRLAFAQVGQEDLVLCRDRDSGRPVVIAGHDRYLNTLVVGPIGAGKSSRILAPLAWQELKNIKRSMDGGIPRGLTIIEPKGDLTDKIAEMCCYLELPFVYINPLREDSARFNPLEGSPGDAAESTRTVLRSMANRAGKQEPFFAAAQDSAARNTILLLKYTRGDRLSLPDVSIALRHPDEMQRDVAALRSVADRMLLDLEYLKKRAGSKGPDACTAMLEYDRLYREYFNRVNVLTYFEKEVFGRTADKFYQFVMGLRLQFDDLVGNKDLFRVISPRMGANGVLDYSSDINLDEHLARGGVLLVNTASNHLGHVGDAFGCYVLQHLQGAVFRRPGNENTRPRHTTIIDELSAYVGPDYERMLSNGRSYRNENIVALQTTAQLVLPGDRDFRERIMNLCRHKVFFGGMDAVEARYVASEMGQSINIERDYTYGGDGGKRSVREYAKEKPRFTVTELMELPEYHVAYKIVRGNRPQTPGIGVTDLCEFDRLGLSAAASAKVPKHPPGDIPAAGGSFAPDLTASVADISASGPCDVPDNLF